MTLDILDELANHERFEIIIWSLNTRDVWLYLLEDNYHDFESFCVHHAQTFHLDPLLGSQEMTKQVPKIHSEFCEGEVSCPTTKQDECGKEMVWNQDGCVSVYCFGCNKIHNVKEVPI